MIDVYGYDDVCIVDVKVTWKISNISRLFCLCHHCFIIHGGYRIGVNTMKNICSLFLLKFFSIDVLSKYLRWNKEHIIIKTFKALTYLVSKIGDDATRNQENNTKLH